jgi:hypothetical protein
MKELLKALADSDRGKEAPPEVEIRLRAAFRRKHQRRVWPYFAATVALAAGVVLTIRVPKPPAHRQPEEIAVVTQELPVPRVTAKPAVVHRKRRPAQEIVTEFYPLMEDPLPFERGELLRVSLPASAMRSVGVPVSEDRLTETVQADVLVGQEGLARAIRFVNTSVNRP